MDVSKKYTDSIRTEEKSEINSDYDEINHM